MVQAQFTIDWFTVDAGGGDSAGGRYSLSGTIAQPDAGDAVTGQNLSVQGGYWTFSAPLPPLPELSLTRGGGQVILMWDDPGFSVRLEASEDLLLWEPVSVLPMLPGWEEPEAMRRFYRLARFE